MGKLNINTFQSVLDYLSITKNSNTINSWLLGINVAILLFLVNNFINPSKSFETLINKIIIFKILIIVLFVWLIINVSILIVFSYKEKILSLAIEDNFYRLKSFISYMDNINEISENELLNIDMFQLHELTNNIKTKKVIDDYVFKILDYRTAIVKWSNKRFVIYRIVIFVSIPLLIAAAMIVFYQL